MKTHRQLANHCIIYDDECPMCALYTGAFVSMDFLDQKGRKPFSQMNPDQFPNLNLNRSKNEIPLVDTATGQVTYGLRSLLKILSHRWAIFGLVEKVPPLFWLISKFYSFISFNRKVIVPGSGDGKACVPTFQLKYRMLYLVFGLLFTAFTYSAFSRLMPLSELPFHWIGWLGIVVGQLVVPLLLMWNKPLERVMEYLGNLVTIMIIGALLMLPATGLAVVVAVPAMAFIPYLVLVIGIVAKEHSRRVQLLELDRWLLIGWSIYWVIALNMITIVSL